MGSKNDWSIMSAAADILDEFNVPYEAEIISAHRTPDRALAYADEAERRGIEVIIAGAGAAAHLPGVIAAKTIIPVLGVPISATDLRGIDALLSMVQMPKGVPVATLAIGKSGAANSALLAISIISQNRPDLRERLRAWRQARRDEVLQQKLP
ncbi:MAG: 5-(carboxyamino)imidazole ribonucleotide mutase [Deltaproteobacteria bacterium]|nr:5-(carboxyamino)imidazole ribonucleotide mutase [Deltaproteobacteria bacterium]